MKRRVTFTNKLDVVRQEGSFIVELIADVSLDLDSDGCRRLCMTVCGWNSLVINC